VTSDTPGPRERLLRSARRLTYTDGVGVGVDAILEDAGVARRSLYQHFGGKDGLIAEVLRSSSERDERRYRSGLAAGGDDPRERVMAFFDGLSTMVSDESFRGCRYLAADLALPDPDHPAHAATTEFRRVRHEMFRAELEQLGHPDPSAGADQIVLLIDGVLVLAATEAGADAVATARPLVQHILDEAHGAPRQTRRPRRVSASK
jgi:AcrR family transcriptional regulator